MEAAIVKGRGIFFQKDGKLEWPEMEKLMREQGVGEIELRAGRMQFDMHKAIGDYMRACQPCPEQGDVLSIAIKAMSSQLAILIGMGAQGDAGKIKGIVETLRPVMIKEAEVSYADLTSVRSMGVTKGNA